MALSKNLQSLLARLDVTNQCFLDTESYTILSELDPALPTNTRESLAKIISDSPASDFIHSRLQDILWQSFDYSQDNRAVKLSTLKGFEDLSVLANRLADELDSLPWHYSVFVRLPFQADCGLQNPTRLSENIQLFVPDENKDKEFSLPKSTMRAFAESLLGRSRDFNSWDSTFFYLRIDLQGYIAGRYSSATLNCCLPMAKSIFGLGLASFFFELKPKGPFYNSPAIPVAIFQRTANGNQFIREGPFPREEAEQICRLTLPAFYTTAPESSGVFSVDPNEVLRNRIDGAAKKISAAFIFTEKGTQLRRAGQWYFEGQCGTNKLLNIVQLATTLEILLGDTKPEKDLTRLLANRCAFLIGSSPTDRDTVMTTFNDAYKLRSKIVHQGLELTNEEEFKCREQLRYLCSRVIQKELKILKGEPVAPAAMS